MGVVGWRFAFVVCECGFLVFVLRLVVGLAGLFVGGLSLARGWWVELVWFIWFWFHELFGVWFRIILGFAMFRCWCCLM